MDFACAIYTQSRISKSSKNYTAPRIAARDAIPYACGMKLNIRDLRKKLGWSQMELAETAGLRQATISKLESRPEKSELATLVKVAEAFGVSVSDLIEGMPNEISIQSLTENFMKLSEEDQRAVTRQIEALAATRDPQDTQ